MIKGSHHSKNSKKRLREIALNQFKNGFPEATKRKLRFKRIGRKPMLGKKHSQKTINLFKLQRKKWWDDTEFRKKSLENRKKMFGDKNPAWKGGVTPTIMRIRQSFKYKEWRKSVYKKDKFTCQLCGYSHNKKGIKREVLDADHIVPFAFLIHQLVKKFGNKNLYNVAMEDKSLWDIENGRILCRKCHKKTDTFLNRWFKKYDEFTK